MSTTEQFNPTTIKWHNPRDVSEAMLGLAHRFLVKEELDGRYGVSGTNTADHWGSGSKWVHRCLANKPAKTYRVPLSTPLPNGWILWRGGERAPCHGCVNYILRGHPDTIRKGSGLDWANTNCPWDIIAYRLVDETTTKTEPETQQQTEITTMTTTSVPTSIPTIGERYITSGTNRKGKYIGGRVNAVSDNGILLGKTHFTHGEWARTNPIKLTSWRFRLPHISLPRLKWTAVTFVAGAASYPYLPDSVKTTMSAVGAFVRTFFA